MCFGNYRDDVLDLLVQAEGWPGGQIEYVSFTPNADVFHHNGTQYPEHHFLVFTFQAHPPQFLATYRGQPCNQANRHQLKKSSSSSVGATFRLCWRMRFFSIDCRSNASRLSLCL